MAHQSNLNGSATNQYNLLTKFKTDMLRLLQTGDGSDVKFVVSKNKPPYLAHSSIIASRCPALRDTVLEYLSERCSPEDPHKHLQICVSSTSEAAMEQVLCYIYTGSITLDSAISYDVLTLSSEFGTTSLDRLVFNFFEDDKNLSLVAPNLDRALYDPKIEWRIISQLTKCLAGQCSKALARLNVSQLSAQFFEHLLKQEQLNVTERQLWEVIIKWACAQCGMNAPKCVSDMTERERELIAPKVRPLCEPGLLRVLDFDTMFMFNEVEPLNVFDSSDLLLKYRYDVLGEDESFACSYSGDHYSFLTRVRLRCMVFESQSHPMKQGENVKQKVQFPSWASLLRVEFDPRTTLERYSDLKLFGSEDLKEPVFSLAEVLGKGMLMGWGNWGDDKSVKRQRSVLSEPLYVDGRELWYTFFTPHNLGQSRGWGYKFTVSIVK